MLYNMQGRLIKSRIVDAGAETILPVNDYARGMYLGMLVAGGKEYRLHVISLGN